MMKKKHLILPLKFTFMTLFVFSAGFTHAALVYTAGDYPGYSNSDQAFANWANAAQNYSIETFESLVPAESLLNISVHGHTFLSGDGTYMTLRNRPTYGLIAHSSPMYLNASDFATGDDCPLIWLPPEPVYGLGFFASDLELGNATITLVFTNNATQTFSVGGNNNFFWGIIGTDEAIKQVTITPPAGDSIGYDDFVVMIPEPTSLILLSLGSVLLLRKK